MYPVECRCTHLDLANSSNRLPPPYSSCVNFPWGCPINSPTDSDWDFLFCVLFCFSLFKFLSIIFFLCLRGGRYTVRCVHCHGGVVFCRESRLNGSQWLLDGIHYYTMPFDMEGTIAVHWTRGHIRLTKWLIVLQVSWWWRNVIRPRHWSSQQSPPQL